MTEILRDLVVPGCGPGDETEGEHIGEPSSLAPAGIGSKRFHQILIQSRPQIPAPLSQQIFGIRKILPRAQQAVPTLGVLFPEGELLHQPVVSIQKLSVLLDPFRDSWPVE